MQRVAIARALISAPTTLLADEPTASLDPATARAVTEIILNQAKERGVTLVFCTHWLDAIMHRCDRIIGLREGTLVLDAKPSEVTQDALDLLYQGSEELYEGNNERI
jgi:phosphonate transport system ATP-binding protein